LEEANHNTPQAGTDRNFGLLFTDVYEFLSFDCSMNSKWMAVGLAEPLRLYHEAHPFAVVGFQDLFAEAYFSKYALHICGVFRGVKPL